MPGSGGEAEAEERGWQQDLSGFRESFTAQELREIIKQ